MATTVKIKPEELPLIWSSLTPEEQRQLWDNSPIVRPIVDPVYWMQNCTKTKDEQELKKAKAENRPPTPNKPFPKYEFFRHLHNVWMAEDMHFVEKSRTLMATWFYAAECLHWAMTRPATVVIFWGPDDARSYKPLGYCGELYKNQDEELGGMWPVVAPWDSQAARRKEFKNGSVLIALSSGDENKIRSEHPTIVMLDEAAQMDAGLAAMGNIVGAQASKVVLITTAYPGWFRSVTQKAKAEEWCYG